MIREKQLDISVDCVIFGYDDEKLKVLIIELQNESNKPVKQAIPGDLILLDESLDDAANRVLNELTGLNGIYLKQYHAFGDPERTRKEEDQYWLSITRKHPDARVVTVSYYSLIRLENFEMHPASFAKNAQWVSIEEIGDLAFDHNILVEKALAALKNDTLNYNITFELLPVKFTLGQLQNLYEIILDKKLDKRNFRKSVKKLDRLVPTGEKQKGVTHKPAELYTYDNKK